MKKILLIIFLFLCCVNVSAEEKKFAGSEYLDGISYMKYDGNTHYYRNAQVIRNTKTNQIAYCVEPFTLLVNDTSYSSSSTYNSNFKINKDSWEKIKLYAYYGYGYQGHTDKKWISITQLSIWRELYPNYQFEWIDNTTSRKIIKPYENEIKELKKLVNNHYNKPSITGKYDMSINSKLTLDDNNKLLNNFKIKKSDFTVNINNNSLIIESGNEVKTGKISLEKKFDNYTNSVMYFYSSSSQNVIERGNIDTLSLELEISTYSGTVEIKKIDSETKDKPQGEAILDGAVFDLYDSDMKYLKSFEIISGSAVIDNLEFGKYYIKEATPGVGYYLNDNIYEFEIDKDNLEKEIIIENNVIKSKVKLIKYYGTMEEYKNNKMKKEADVTFEIYNKDNEKVFSGVTDKNGILEFYLPYGSYIVKQINSKNGYQLNDDFILKIDEENSYSTEIPLYDFKIKVYNAGINSFEYLKTWMNNLCLN